VPTLWFEDSNIGLPGGTTPDWEQTFTEPEKWSQTLQALDTYSINNDGHLIDPNDPVPDSFLRDHLVPTLNRYQVSLALGTGAATWMNYNMERFGVTAEQILDPYRDLIDKLRSYGARLNQVTLFAVLCAPLEVDGQTIDYPMEQRIQDAVDYARYMTSHFPDLRIGILDYLPTQGQPYREPYAQLRDALAAEGIELDHIHLAVPAGVAFHNAWGMSWAKAVDVQAYVQQELGLKFGATLTSDEGGYQSGEYFHNQTIEALRAYQQAVADSSYPDEFPDRYLLTSWYPYPGRSLPESPVDPSVYTTTRTALAMGRELDDDEEWHHIFPIAVESRTSAEGYDPWNLLNGRGLIDRENTPTTQCQWISEPYVDANEWVKVEFCRPQVLDALRVWNLNGATVEIDQNGVSIMDIYTSVSGIGNPVDNPDQWQWLDSPGLDIAASEGDDPGQLIDLPNREALAAALVLRENYGGDHIGLGELRFLAETDTTVAGNDRPWFDPLPDVVLDGWNWDLPLSGIVAGCGEQQPLKVTATGTNPNLYVGIDYQSPDTTGDTAWIR